MNKTRKTKVIRGPTVGPSEQSIWRRVVKLFRRDHNPLLVASLTAFNAPRIYIPPDFNWPLSRVLSCL
jgi:hypothetical protein